MVVDSGMAMDKVSISNGSSCGNRAQENDVAALMASVLFNSESETKLSNGETVYSNMDLLSQTQLSDNHDSVLCPSECNADYKKTDPVAIVEHHSGCIAEDAADCKDACFSTEQGQNTDVENDSLHPDSNDIDVYKLQSALWPKRKFVMDVDTDYSFAALSADLENFCKENQENVTRQETYHSDCGETGTAHDVHEAEWPAVSQWLKESQEKFSKQFPQCSALVHGLPVSDRTLDANSGMLSPKMTVCTDNMQALNSTPFSSEVNAVPVCSLHSQSAGISSYVNDAGLGTESGSSNQLTSAMLLSREKILSLQFGGVPLSPQVISRVKELKLKRTDGASRPADCKRLTRNTPSSKQLESNLSSSTVLQTSSVLTEIPANSASTTDARNQSAVKLDAVSAAGTDTATSSTLPNPHAANVKQAPVSYERHTSSSALPQPVGSEARTVLRSDCTSRSMTSQSNTAAIVSRLSPVSVTLADAELANVTSNKEVPVHKLQSVVKTTHENPLKLSNTDVTSRSSAALLPGTSVSITAPVVTAVTHQKTIQSATKLQLSPQAASSVSAKPPTKKQNAEVTDTAETLADHNYYKDFVLSPVQQHVAQSEYNATNRNPRQETYGRFTEESCRKSRQTSSYAEASVKYPDAVASDWQKGSKSRRPVCSRCRNVKSNADPSARKSHASRHSTARDIFDHYSAHGSCYMPSMTPSVLASVSYSSYCLGAYDAHVCSMHYYNMLSHQETTATMWQQQADYIRRVAKFYARS